MLIPLAENGEITPAMLTVLWGIADALDQRRIPADIGDAVWLEIPSRRLRNPLNPKADNYWLRQCLDRLTGLKLRGEYRGNPWGAVILAEWHIERNGSIVRALIPPAAVAAIRSPATFAKIEIAAAYRLKGHARRLYAALADMKRRGKAQEVYSLDEIRSVLEVDGQYALWHDLNRYVLQPALAEINDFGTVAVTMTPQKLGKAVAAVRFDWKWKTLDEARETDEENERHRVARRKGRTRPDAPPLSPAVPELAAKDGDEMVEDRRAADRARAKAWIRVNGGTIEDYLAATAADAEG